MKIVLKKPYFEYISKNLPEYEFYQTIEECLDTEILIGLPDNITTEDLDKLLNLKWIQLTSAGYNDIDIEYLKNRNISLTNARDIYSIPIAEDVLCKILMSNCNTLKYLENQNKHIWKQGIERKELCGQTVGIIGTGSIATEIAKRLQGFGVKIIGYKRNSVSSVPYFDEVYTGQENLNYILSISDYVVVTVDLNNDTYHMLNKSNLKYMKKSASIINIARGSVINQIDLTEVLKKKEINYAGLDVFETEPLPQNDELWDLDNVYITAHSSAIVKNNKVRMHKLIVDNINRYINNEPLINIII